MFFFKESHSSFYTSVPGEERGPFDLEALAEGADTVFTMLIPLSSKCQLAFLSKSLVATPHFVPMFTLGPTLFLDLYYS